MSDYGVKYKIIQAGSIYECNIGVRDELDMKDGMMCNSLFLDFLLANHMKLWKEESTRDIICIDFKYGSRSYEEEHKHLSDLLSGTPPDNEERIAKLTALLQKCEDDKDKFDKRSKYELRDIFYRDGVSVTFHTHTKSGEIKKSETLHYQMLYRTPGKAKVGKCVFICDRLYKKAKKFLTMGIRLPKRNAPIVEIGAYSSLITSTIVGRVRIDPDEILVLEDIDSYFTTNVVSIETNERRECIAVKRDGYQVKNTLFDGQALIDSSIFPTWGDGYILLRHHMCKMAAFSTNIQKFFRDYFGDDYETATVTDMFGNVRPAKAIKLITTDNAMKFLKFGVTYDYWAEKVRENGSLFGIVKTAHQSKFGDVQKMSYQMVNSLDLGSMPLVMNPTEKYIHQLQTDDQQFIEYLRQNINFSNDYEALIALVDQDPSFVQSKYFRERKYAILKAYLLKAKSGKLIQNADNLVIVGSIYAMLLHSVGEDVNKDPTFSQEDGTIQCYTGRFDDGEYLAAFRSPHNGRNNINYLHNVHHPYMDKYFNLGKLILVVNLIGTDFQDRSNGSDQDSDSVFVTNQPDIVRHAKRCYAEYPTIVNNIPKEKNSWDNTPESFSAIDNRLAMSQRSIGESSNLAQLCLTYSYCFEDQKYDDYVCILSVLAQAAIDSAKRAFDIDIPSEIKRIKKDMEIDKNLYPAFWKIIKRDFNPVKRIKTKDDGYIYKNMVNDTLQCPMNRLYAMQLPQTKSKLPTKPMSDFFIRYELKHERKTCRRIEDMIEKYSLELYKYNMNHTDDISEFLLLRSDFEDLIRDIQQIHISNNYLGLMSWLIDRAFQISPRMNQKVKSNLNRNRAALMNVLYHVGPRQFLQCFSKNLGHQSDGAA